MNLHSPRIDSVGDAEFKAALRQLASSVAVVTALSANQRGGVTATSICPLTAHPPTLLACVSDGTPGERLIRDSGAFAVNVLAEDQHAIARRFSATSTRKATSSPSENGSASSPAPRAGGRRRRIRLPSRGWLTTGDHHLYFGRVIGVSSCARDVLLYRDRLFRRLEASAEP